MRGLRSTKYKGDLTFVKQYVQMRIIAIEITNHIGSGEVWMSFIVYNIRSSVSARETGDGHGYMMWTRLSVQQRRFR